MKTQIERRTPIHNSLIISIVIAFGLSGSTVRATVLHVPGTYGTIQAAIDAAENGDTIIVADGIYTGDGNRDLDFHGKAITLCSENGPETCIIDCAASWEDLHGGFRFHSGETAEAMVSGFLITNGVLPEGAGVDCSDSSPTFVNCIIIGNTAYSGEGGGVILRNSGATFTHCTITRNHAYEHGGGLFITSSDENPTLANCTITGNSTGESGGGLCCMGGSPAIINCVICGNNGSGISNFGDNPTLANCTLSGNSLNGITNYGVGQATLSHSVVWGNMLAAISAQDGSVTATYCNLQGGTGEPWFGIGCLDTDPHFARMPNPGPDLNWGTADDDYGDLHLTPDSPCINTGHPYYTPPPDQTDIDGEPRIQHGRVDMGADEATLFTDCNDNGTPDSEDIITGASLDCNENWIPDECESLAAGDFDNDGDVDFHDYQALIGSMAGPDNPVTASSPDCVPIHLAAFDFDNDGDEDLCDLAVFQRLFQNNGTRRVLH